MHTPTTKTEKPLVVPENDNADEDDTEVSSMSWVRIQELEYVRRICADVMKRMKR